MMRIEAIPVRSNRLCQGADRRQKRHPRLQPYPPRPARSLARWRPGNQVANTRFQQLSAPVAAKAVEDTAFYRYGRLLSRNDVGFDPARLGSSIADFHCACADRLSAFPNAMLATATHDHKRGEDLRARLAIITEIPDDWATFLAQCQRVATNPPDPADEIMLYQMIVGAWPLRSRPI